MEWGRHETLLMSWVGGALVAIAAGLSLWTDRTDNAPKTSVEQNA